MKLQGSVIFFQHNCYRHYYLCHYLPLTSGSDTVSRSLLKFKRGIQPDLDNWLSRALTGLGGILPTLPPDTIIIRALHHKETTPTAINKYLPAGHNTPPPSAHMEPLPTANNTPLPAAPGEPLPSAGNEPPSTGGRPSSLDLLGQALSTHSRFPYLPALLHKRRPTAINQGLTRSQRETELRDVYFINPAALTSIASATPALEPPIVSATHAPEPSIASATQTPEPPIASATPTADLLPTSPFAPDTTATPPLNPSTGTPAAGSATYPTAILLPTTNPTTLPTPTPPSSILLLDDILTTGTTVLSILKTLHTAWPNSTVTIFTLAKVI